MYNTDLIQALDLLLDLAKTERGQQFLSNHHEVLDLLEKVRSGTHTPEEVSRFHDILNKQHSLFMTDHMTGLGNQESFDIFKEKHGDSGFHVAIDGNDFGLINKHLGFEVGDHGIKEFGRIFSEAAGKHGGRGFRKGGDEFHFHFDTHEGAANFVREARAGLEAHPRIGGIVNLAAGFGVGKSYSESERALENSKWAMGPPEPDGKRRNLHGFGSAPSTVFNSITGTLDRTPTHISVRDAPTEAFIKANSKAYQERAPRTPPPEIMAQAVKLNQQPPHVNTAPAAIPKGEERRPASSPMLQVQKSVSWGDVLAKAVPVVPHPKVAPRGYNLAKVSLKSDPKIAPPSHAAVNGGKIGIVTAQNPRGPVEIEGGNSTLESEFKRMGLNYEPAPGKYDVEEHSYIVHGPTEDQMAELGRKFGQESVVHSEGGRHKLIYTHGEHAGTYRPGEGVNLFGQAPDNYYTTIHHEGKPVHFNFNINWDAPLIRR